MYLILNAQEQICFRYESLIAEVVFSSLPFYWQCHFQALGLQN